MPKSIDVTLDLRAAADFRLTIPTKRAYVVAGTNATYDVSAERLGGYLPDVLLTTDDTPSGATATFDDNELSVGESAVLTVGTTSVSAGTHYFYAEGAEAPTDVDWFTTDYPERSIDWSDAGVWYNADTPTQPWNGTKGIPTYAVDIDLTGLSSYGGYTLDNTGVVNSQAAIQAALNACATSRAALLGPGTYRIESALSIPSYKALRGAGAWLTTIQVEMGDAPGITMTGGGYNETGYSISSGYTKGSTQLVMSGSHPFQVGDIAMIDQLNSGDIFSVNCSWCGRGGGARSMRQSRIVTAVDGNTITFHKPLYWDYSAGLSPELCRSVTSTRVNAGLEDLTVYVGGGSSTSGVYSYGSIFCWMKGVRITNIGRYGFRTHTGCVGFEIRRCYVDHSKTFTSSHGYGLHLLIGGTDMLIEDNIFKYNHLHMSIEAGGCGNVVGYNHMETQQDIPGWYQCAIMHYGAHSYYNLYEGNVFGKINPMDEFGSRGYQTVFRNHINRQNPGVSVEGPLVCAIVDRYSYYDNFIGNVLGYSGMGGDYELDNIPSINSVLVWKIGYQANQTGYPTDAKVAETIMRHGNYCYLDDTTRWEDDISARLISDSLYYSSKPSWFGSYDWPCIGPDVSGYSGNFPAKARWEAYEISDDLEDLF